LRIRISSTVQRNRLWDSREIYFDQFGASSFLSVQTWPNLGKAGQFSRMKEETEQ